MKITEWLSLIQTCLIKAIKQDLARGGKRVLIKLTIYGDDEFVSTV